MPDYRLPAITDHAIKRDTANWPTYLRDEFAAWLRCAEAAGAQFTCCTAAIEFWHSPRARELY
jgi:hypothetical protein